jgi:phosphoglycerate dehydrogenase-like enzyme
MRKAPLTIWCNTLFPEPSLQLLRDGTRDHHLVFAQAKTAHLASGEQDPTLEQADIAFGQPHPEQIIACQRLSWVQLDSAGYTRYDRDAVRIALAARGAVLTNSSSVYDDACAHHVLAMMLCLARQLPPALLDQHTTHAWRSEQHRANSHLLGGQTVLMLGFGAIGHRLVELLQPFRMNVIATRRNPRGDEPIKVYPDAQTDTLLGDADHVINLLPDNPSTRDFFCSARFTRMKRSARFYNIGRGSTVDQSALIAALFNQQIAGAYLDVTSPEPLRPDHVLWTAPNCFITPHTGGGYRDEHEALVRHFLANLRRFASDEPLINVVIGSSG